MRIGGTLGFVQLLGAWPLATLGNAVCDRFWERASPCWGPILANWWNADFVQLLGRGHWPLGERGLRPLLGTGFALGTNSFELVERWTLSSYWVVAIGHLGNADCDRF